MKALFTILLLSVFCAQAQDNTLQAGKDFEGSIFFNVNVSGPMAHKVKEISSIERMVWHMKGASYIIITIPKQKPQPQRNQPTTTTEENTTRMYIADSNELYTLDLRNRRAFLREHAPEKVGTIPTATPISDSVEVAGFMCYGYQVQKKNQTVTYYVCPQFRINPALFKDKNESRIAYVTKGLDGYIPLKIIKASKNLTTTITATQVQQRELDDREFRIPPGFKIEPFDYRR